MYASSKKNNQEISLIWRNIFSVEIQLIVPREKKIKLSSDIPCSIYKHRDRKLPGRDTYFLVEFFHFCPAFRSKVLLKFLGFMLPKVRPIFIITSKIETFFKSHYLNRLFIFLELSKGFIINIKICSQDLECIQFLKHNQLNIF